MIDQDGNTKSKMMVPMKSSSDAGNSAADVVESFTRSADLLRGQGAYVRSLAATIEATAEALALDYERRAEDFQRMVSAFQQYARDSERVFEDERARLDQFAIPKSRKANGE